MNGSCICAGLTGDSRIRAHTHCEQRLYETIFRLGPHSTFWILRPLIYYRIMLSSYHIYFVGFDFFYCIEIWDCNQKLNYLHFNHVVRE